MYKRLKELRIKNDYTSYFISNYLNINKITYFLYENGYKKIPISVLSKLAKLYNTSIDYIIEETNEIIPHTKI